MKMVIISDLFCTKCGKIFDEEHICIPCNEIMIQSGDPIFKCNTCGELWAMPDHGLDEFGIRKNPKGLLEHTCSKKRLKDYIDVNHTVLNENKIDEL